MMVMMRMMVKKMKLIFYLATRMEIHALPIIAGLSVSPIIPLVFLDGRLRAWQCRHKIEMQSTFVQYSPCQSYFELLKSSSESTLKLHCPVGTRGIKPNPYY